MSTQPVPKQIRSGQRDSDPPPSTSSDGPDAAEMDEEPKPLGQEAPEVVEDAARIGDKRLHRSHAGSAITSLIGGMSVTFGAIAMAWAAASFGAGVAEPSVAHFVGAVVFPVGFIILLVGKSELFTENFFLPVSAVLERRGSLLQLAELWGISLASNLEGGAIFAFLVSRPGVLAPAVADELIALATHKLHDPFWTAFIKAIFAGWLMTMLTWLLVAAVGFGPRLAIIWTMAALIVLAQFNHVVISAVEIFMAMFFGAPITLGTWLTRNFLPALAGNVLGGVVFVTLLTHVQARAHQTAPNRDP